MSLIPVFSPRTGNSEGVPPPSTTFEREGNGVDCNGHGSHVAGIIGGQTFGVAKKVRLFGVRVLNCQGTGTWSDVIDGVNFVTWHRAQPAQQGIPGAGQHESRWRVPTEPSKRQSEIQSERR